MEGLADGTLEIIGSDHAPHPEYLKEVEFDYAPFGITGLETELAISLMRLYHTGKMKLPQILQKLTVQPAKLLRLQKGTLDIGADGDVTIFDPDFRWVYKREESVSKSLKPRAAAATSDVGPTLWMMPSSISTPASLIVVTARISAPLRARVNGRRC